MDGSYNNRSIIIMIITKIMIIIIIITTITIISLSNDLYDRRQNSPTFLATLFDQSRR